MKSGFTAKFHQNYLRDISTNEMVQKDLFVLYGDVFIPVIECIGDLDNSENDKLICETKNKRFTFNISQITNSNRFLIKLRKIKLYDRFGMMEDLKLYEWKLRDLLIEYKASVIRTEEYLKNSQLNEFRDLYPEEFI